jgi:hypothetical protein
MRAAQSQQRLSQRCGRLRLSQRHAGGAVTATAADGAASANVTPTAGQKSKKVPETRKMLTFGIFGTFWRGRVTSEQLSQVTRQNHDFSKSQKNCSAPNVHMSQIGVRLFPKSRATSEWPFVLQTIQV